MPIGNIWSGISFRHDDSIFVALAEPCVSVDAAVVKVVVDVVIELFVEVAVVVVAAAASEVIVVVIGVDVVTDAELFIRVIRSIRLTVKVFVSSSSRSADELSPNAVALITKTLVFPLSTTTW